MKNRMLQLNEMLNEVKLYSESEALDAIRLAMKKLKKSEGYKNASYGATGSPADEWTRSISEIENILRSVKLSKRQ